MGRTVRRVPRDWRHPRDSSGNYIPTYEKFTYTPEEVKEGLQGGWLSGQPPHYNLPIMPQWSDDERTHYQMYEDCTEGTPISPVMESPESLARWLTDNDANAFAGRTATYEEWLAAIRAGWTVSAVITDDGLISGVEFEGQDARP